MSLHVLGISHRTASAQARAAATVTPQQVGELLAAAARQAPDLEVLALATCNRTEFYLAGEDAVARWTAVVASTCPVAPTWMHADGWYHHEDAEALRHLLRVACGLDSLLLGDTQVLGQLRASVTASERTGTLGRTLGQATALALRTGRQARATTSIAVGTPGIGPAVAEAISSCGVPRGGTVLVLGSGGAGRLAVRALRKAGYSRLSLANRTDATCREVAGDLQVAWTPWADVTSALATADAVVVATGAPQAVVTALPDRATPVLVVDAGFPPQVGPDVAASGATVVSLEALTSAADAATQRRLAAVPEVEELVAGQVDAWLMDQERAPLESAIKALHARVGAWAADAAATLHGAPLDVSDVERLLARSMKALLHPHVEQLRALQPRSGAETS
ncbi:MAG: hypothetical protein Q8R60_18915 [Mycobacteriales bacterium]|nr:hypothetical protein [Mycobacteriales bacterium]